MGLTSLNNVVQLGLRHKRRVACVLETVALSKGVFWQLVYFELGD